MASSRTVRITVSTSAIQGGGLPPSPTVMVRGAGTLFLVRPWRRTEYPAWARARASPTPARPGPMSPIAPEDCWVTYFGPSTSLGAWWRVASEPAADWRDLATRRP